MALVKNNKGRIVEVTDERKAYLLADKPMALNSLGKPKLNSNQEPIYLTKGDNEKGYTDVTKDEEKAFYTEQEEAIALAEEANTAQEAAQTAVVAATMAAVKAAKTGDKAATKSKGGRKSKAQKEQEAAEAEAKLREAEGDQGKYDALSDEEKEEFEKLGLAAPDAE